MGSWTYDCVCYSLLSPAIFFVVAKYTLRSSLTEWAFASSIILQRIHSFRPCYCDGLLDPITPLPEKFKKPGVLGFFPEVKGVFNVLQ